MSIDVHVLNAAGSVFEVNNDWFNALPAYDAVASYKEDSTSYLNAGIVYYVLAMKNVEKKSAYLLKAKRYLEKGACVGEENPKIHYYLGLVYSEMENMKEAYEEFKMLENYPDFMEDHIVMSTIEAYLTAAMLSVKEDEEAYSLIEDPFLISLYDFIKPKLVDSGKADDLAKKYKSKTSVAIAKEILNVVKFIDTTFGKLPVAARFEALLFFLVRGTSAEEVEFVKDNLKSYGFDISSLPPYTKGIILEFRRLFGIGGVVSLPYFVREDIRLITTVNAYFVDLVNDVISPDEALRRIQSILPSRIDFIKKFMEKHKDQFIDKNMAVSAIKELFLILCRRLRDRALAFFDQARVKNIIKAVVSTLGIPDADKLNIVSSLF